MNIILRPECRVVYVPHEHNNNNSNKNCVAEITIIRPNNRRYDNRKNAAFAENKSNTHETDVLEGVWIFVSRIMPALFECSVCRDTMWKKVVQITPSLNAITLHL